MPDPNPELRWFGEWLTAHLVLHKQAQGLPDPESDRGVALYDTWQHDVGARPISRDGAAAASRRLVRAPARFRTEHFAKFLEYAVEETRRLDPRPDGQPAHDLTTREGAQAASLGCARCGGQGLAAVEYHDPERAARLRLPATTSAYCVCALGRWTMQNHGRTAPDVLRRQPDLADAIAGRGPWRVHPMSEPERLPLRRPVHEEIHAMTDRPRPAPAPAPPPPRPVFRGLVPPSPVPPPAVPEGAAF